MSTAAKAAEAKRVQDAFLDRLADRVASHASNRGPPRKLSIRYVLGRIWHVCTSGCSWRDLEVPGGSPKTVFHHFNRWSRMRLFDDEFHDLAKLYFLSSETPCNLVADTSFVKNVYGQDVLGSNPVDRGRRATKVSVLADTLGAPLFACYHAANKNDCTTLRHLLDQSSRTLGPLEPCRMLLADKGYDTLTCRAACIRHGLNPIIDHKRKRRVAGAPRHPPQPSDPRGRRRIMVEHVFGRLDQKRRLRVRYEAKIVNFRSFHSLGFTADLARRLVRSGHI
ncbi:IS5 family transposase [Rhodovarius sp.]|uniref:IS5 family transposase n=1 Tax=Rhodovarius sp. TaxID=2972673 RepID=UPI00333E9FEA